jgi:xylan 1,4-beta-xylosidase
MQRRRFLKKSAGLAAAVLAPELLSENAPAAAQGDTFPVQITIDAAAPIGPLVPIWRFFGYDEPNFTYGKDGKKLLSELGKLGGGPADQVYVRTHHLLTSGDGVPALKWGSTNAYTEDAAGNPVYDWTITDRIFDTYLQRGLKPYVQMGFMPQALSIHPEDYPHDPPANVPLNPGVGFSYPPKDYGKWGELCYQWAKHCADKYGRAEAASWYWEVWNEPNISYWKGTRAEYYRLYDHAVEGVRRALPTARVGGPEVAGGAGGTFLHEFLEHCARGVNDVTGKPGAPLDFLSFHAKGSPAFVDGHVRMGINRQLLDMERAFAVIASFPEYKNTPIVIGESDPEGCAACKGPQNGYRNGTMYSSYTAASFARAHDLAAKHGVNLLGALTWAFEFENQPYFAGFRVLASNGIDHPVLNMFRMFAKMSGQRLRVESSAAVPLPTLLSAGVRADSDVAALASQDGKRVCVLVWNYHDDDVAGPSAAVSLEIKGLPSRVGSTRVRQYRIDATHSNAYDAWKSMGSPQSPTPAQYARLETAGQLALADDPSALSFEKGLVKLRIDLPRQAVSLLEIEWS